MTDDLLMSPSEELLWSGTPRLSAATESLLVGLVLVLGGVAGVLFLPPDAAPVGRVVLGLLVPLGFAVPTYRLLALRRTRYAVSDAALYARTGVLSRSVRRMGLDRVQNSAYSQSFLGSMFGYGTVTVESAGGEAPLRFVRIESPRETRALVDRRVELAADPIPGTSEQWTAVLTEVRALRRVVETRGEVTGEGGQT